MKNSMAIFRAIGLVVVFFCSCGGATSYGIPQMSGIYRLEQTDCPSFFFYDEIEINQFIRIREEVDGENSIGFNQQCSDFLQAGGKVNEVGDFYFENDLFFCSGNFDNNQDFIEAECAFGESMQNSCFVSFLADE